MLIIDHILIHKRAAQPAAQQQRATYKYVFFYIMRTQTQQHTNPYTCSALTNATWAPLCVLIACVLRAVYMRGVCARSHHSFHITHTRDAGFWVNCAAAVAATAVAVDRFDSLTRLRQHNTQQQTATANRSAALNNWVLLLDFRSERGGFFLCCFFPPVRRQCNVCSSIGASVRASDRRAQCYDMRRPENVPAATAAGAPPLVVWQPCDSHRHNETSAWRMCRKEEIAWCVPLCSCVRAQRTNELSRTVMCSTQCGDRVRVFFRATLRASLCARLLFE